MPRRARKCLRALTAQKAEGERCSTWGASVTLLRALCLKEEKDKDIDFEETEMLLSSRLCLGEVNSLILRPKWNMSKNMDLNKEVMYKDWLNVSFASTKLCNNSMEIGFLVSLDGAFILIESANCLMRKHWVVSVTLFSL